LKTVVCSEIYVAGKVTDRKMITNCFICTYFMTFFWYAAQAQPRPAPAPLPPRSKLPCLCQYGEHKNFLYLH